MATLKRFTFLILTAIAITVSGVPPASAALGVPPASAAIPLAQSPLFFPGNLPPLNMVVMGRDHTLYYEAYNDASDLNGDGVLNVGYEPNKVVYFGYFDSYKCYTYNSSGRFDPVAMTPETREGRVANDTKTCPGQWSGDFLNYITTARIDALRKVLYGGRRVVDDDDGLTVLERTYIPQDAHSWGKEYHSIARDGYDISQYTPLELPAAGTRHLFANTTLLKNDVLEPKRAADMAPLLRVLTDSRFRIWNWVAIERHVAGSRCMDGRNNNNPCVQPPSEMTDYEVRVKVCDPAALEPNCKQYATHYKPTGLLHSYGEQDRMLFGLITGSYKDGKNIAGGVLRKNIESFKNEIDPDTGQFTDLVGIVRTIDRLQIVDFNVNTNYEYRGGFLPGSPLSSKPSDFPDWGNPIAEMMYESLRYFSGKDSPTSQFMPILTDGMERVQLRHYTAAQYMDLPVMTAKTTKTAETWQDPYDPNERPYCTPAAQLVISDVNPSYDTQYVPGSAFNSFTGDISGLNASQEANAIWDKEHGGPGQHFIGQSGTDDDGAPSEKTVTGLGNIRGLSPAEPTKEGGYYSAAIAKYAYENDIRSDLQGEQKIQTFAVALASPLPRIEIPVGDDLVTLVPFGKTVDGPGINKGEGSFQPTNTIVDFFVEAFANTDPLGSDADKEINDGRAYVRFRINFENMEQGADHDMDAIIIYELSVNADGILKVNLTREYEAAGRTMNYGYVVSGTTADGIYLEVSSKDTNTAYFLNTPATRAPGYCDVASPPTDCANLPQVASRDFNPGAAGATLLENPLWYAAKYGSDGNDKLDSGDTSPNYFLVTNASTLQQQLENAFQAILGVTTSASAVATNSTRLGSESLIYQARFRSDDWTGELRAFPTMTLATTGSLVVEWDAGDLIPDPTARNILTLNPDSSATSRGLPFLWSDLEGTDYEEALDADPKDSSNIDGLAQDRLEWLRGDASQEEKNGGLFRDRSRALGDIVNFNPVLVQKDYFAYELLPAGAGKESYLSFYEANQQRTAVVYVGANDGMLHAFDAETGVEKFAYIPGSLIPALNQLTHPEYIHRYYVDGQGFAGDAYFGGSWKTVLVSSLGAGGRGVFALDVTDPDSFGPDNVLWEFTAADDPDVGHIMGKPQVFRMANGAWAAVFGNGYNSAAHQAYLFVVNLETGALIKKIPTGVGSEPNGLAPPALMTDETRTVTTAYAGDLLGNLWKFDLSSSNPASWESAFDPGVNPAPLFVAISQDGEPQPITGEPSVIRQTQHSDGGYLVLFGTGRYFAVGDNVIKTADDPVQSLYGIWDNDAPVSITQSTRGTVLQEQTILAEPAIVGLDTQARVLSDHAVDWTSKQGWFVDLWSPAAKAQNKREGERYMFKPRVRNDRVIFASWVPSEDPCVFGGHSWINEIDAQTGGRVGYTLFDINQDGAFDEGDFVEVQIDSETVMVPVSGLRISGLVSAPTIIRTGQSELRLFSTTDDSAGTDPGVDSSTERASAATAAAEAATAAAAAAAAASEAADAARTGDLAKAADKAAAAAAKAAAAAAAAAKAAQAVQAVATIDPSAAAGAAVGAAGAAAAAAAEQAAAAAAASSTASSTSDLAEAQAAAAAAAVGAADAASLAKTAAGIAGTIADPSFLSMIERESMRLLGGPSGSIRPRWRQIQ